MKVIIAGSRTCTMSVAELEAVVKASGFTITEVVSGCANGADKLGEQWAVKYNIPVKQFPADWKNIKVPGAIVKQNAYGFYNARAGIMRNEEMAHYADTLIALWDGKSAGTWHMIQYAQSLGLKVYVHRYGKALPCGLM